MSIPSNDNLLVSSMGDTNVADKRIVSYAANQSVRPYSTNQEYLYAMREDLADWLKGLYAVEIDAVNFFKQLETGILLCQHANNITACAEYMQKNKKVDKLKSGAKFPTKLLVFHQGRYVRAGSFFARDNIASFIGWCRNELKITDAVMFETNDLVLRYNEKNVILCLLEVARRGSKFGVPAPVLVQMEEEIDEEIEIEKVAKERNEAPRKLVKHKTSCDFKSLDEMVQYVLGMCTCPSQFPMVKVSDGKYKVGDSENLIFMRILRQHVMVRVGGGWDTLEHYLNKHDPCRCQKHKTERTFTPRHSRSQSATRSAGQPSQQHQRSLTSTGIVPKASVSSTKKLATSDRMSKSNSNLAELTPNEKNGKRYSEPKRSIPQSRNSSASDTSGSEKRSLTSRQSHSTEKNYAARNTPNKKERLSLQSDVFNRLSRPKSTPPISRPLSTQQDETLVVQRNKKGSHQVQRASTPRNSRTNATNSERSRTRSSDISFLRSKSSAALTPSVRGEDRLFGSKTGRPNRSLQTNKGQSFGSNTARSSRARSKSATRDNEARERELLQAFEKECINNQYSLQHDRPKSIPRQSSIDSLLNSQRLSSCTSSEDNEVALHMQQVATNPELKPSHPPPSSYSSLSLPRPRKDKREQHERRTRIPTPVSFNKPLLASKSIDFVEEMSKGEKPTKAEAVRKEAGQSTTVGSEQKKQVVNGIGRSNGLPSPQIDMKPVRAALPLDKINRLLNSGKFDFENEVESDLKDPFKDEAPLQLDSGFLRSSGHTSNRCSRASQFAFVPVQPRSSAETRRQPDVFNNISSSASAPQQNNPDGKTDDKPRGYGSSPSVRSDVNNGPGVHPGNGEASRSSRLPSYIMKACGLTPDPSFGAEVRRNGFKIPPDSNSKSHDPQWV